MRKMIITLGLVAVVLVGGTYVYAQGMGHGRMGRGYGNWFFSTNEQRTRSHDVGQRLNEEAPRSIGSAWGMGPVFGDGHMMDTGRGHGYGMGSGYGMGLVEGTCY